MMRKTWHRWA